MRTFLVAMAVVAFAATPALAVSITVDGNISDWQAAGLVRTDPVDNLPPAALDIIGYGATVSNGMFYAMLEFNRQASDFDGTFGGNNRIYADATIDADSSTSTALSNLSGTTQNTGTDIMVEWGRNRRNPPVNFWGAQGDLSKLLTGDPGGASGTETGVTGAVYADSGSAATGVLEWGCPVSSITAALAGLPANVTPNPSQWVVSISGQGRTNVNTSLGSAYGYDFTTPFTIPVPEPGMLAMLMAAGAALLGYALRRRS